jgi:hypothetical protein
MSKRTSYGKIYRPDVLFIQMSADIARTSTRVPVYPADAILLADGFKSKRQYKSVRADAFKRPRGRELHPR